MSSAGTVTNSTTREQAKQYLAMHHIPQMFESLLSCLMMERPEDPVSYIEDKMSEIRTIGANNVNWETFVYQLHPYRDPVRRHFVRDGSKFDKEFEENERKMKEMKINQELQSRQNSHEKYQTELFKLTEYN